MPKIHFKRQFNGHHLNLNHLMLKVYEFLPKDLGDHMGDETCNLFSFNLTPCNFIFSEMRDQIQIDEWKVIIF
jgi:hypothetical protein